jgi:hypothetical protein
MSTEDNIMVGSIDSKVERDFFLVDEELWIDGFKSKVEITVLFYDSIEYISIFVDEAKIVSIVLTQKKREIDM